MMKFILLVSAAFGLTHSAYACVAGQSNLVTLESGARSIVFSKVTSCAADGSNVFSDQIVVSSDSQNVFFIVHQADFNAQIPGQQNALLSALQSGPSPDLIGYFKGPLLEQIDAALGALPGLSAEQASQLFNDIHTAMVNAVLYIQ